MADKKICDDCKYFDGQCQNFNLTRAAKTKRFNGFECEFWEECKKQTEGTKSVKQTLLDMAVQLEKIAYALKDKEE